MENDEGRGLQRSGAQDGRPAQKSKAHPAGRWIGGIAWFETRTGIVWKIRYRAPITTTTRRTKQITETIRYCRSRAQAQAVLAQRQAQVFDGTYRPRSNEAPLTVADFAPKFLEAKSELATHKKYASQLRLHLLPRFGKKLLSSVTLGDCEDYRRERQAEGAEPATVRNELRCLQSLFIEAMRRELVSKDPVAGMSFRIDNARRRLLSDDERARLLAHLAKREDFLRPLFLVLGFTGMRLGDALSLGWSAIDFGAGKMAFRQRKTGRWVYPPLHAQLAAELKRWRSVCESTKWIFPSPRGWDAPMSKNHAGRAWDEMLKDTKVENLWRHDLRRYVVTMLRARGVGDRVIASITGHESVQMIERYDSPEIEHAREAVARLPDLTAISLSGNPRATTEAQDGQPKDISDKS